MRLEAVRENSYGNTHRYGDPRSEARAYVTVAFVRCGKSRFGCQIEGLPNVVSWACSMVSRLNDLPS
jgi:hypothetical protein